VVLRASRHPRATPVVPTLRAVLVALLSTLALLGPVAGLAHADTSDDIYADFRKTGRIDPCKYTAKELRDAKSGIGSDADQYAPEYPDALDEAIAGSGDCKSASTGAAATPSRSTSTGSSRPSTPSTPAPTTTSSSSATPAPTTTAVVTPVPTTPAPAAVAQPSAAATDGVIAARTEAPGDNGPHGWAWAILVAAILAASALGWALVNATGRVQWLAPLGHSMGEAGWRIGLRWAEFRDWMRFGTGR
jgi:hypothetical protein